MVNTSLLHSDGGRSARLVALGRDNHVVGGSHLEASIFPSIEMVLRGDGTAHAVVGADRPVLVEGGSAFDRRRILAGGLVDLVGAVVGLHGAELLGAGGRIVGAERFNNVILDQRVLGPAVD